MCQTLSENTRKARKSHRCVWCGETILVGEDYIDHRLILEDEPETQRWHPECYKTSQILAGWEGDCFEFTFGEFARGSTNEA